MNRIPIMPHPRAQQSPNWASWLGSAEIGRTAGSGLGRHAHHDLAHGAQIARNIADLNGKDGVAGGQSTVHRDLEAELSGGEWRKEREITESVPRTGVAGAGDVAETAGDVLERVAHRRLGRLASGDLTGSELWRSTVDQRWRETGDTARRIVRRAIADLRATVAEIVTADQLDRRSHRRADLLQLAVDHHSLAAGVEHGGTEAGLDDQ